MLATATRSASCPRRSFGGRLDQAIEAIRAASRGGRARRDRDQSGSADAGTAARNRSLSDGAHESAARRAHAPLANLAPPPKGGDRIAFMRRCPSAGGARRSARCCSPTANCSACSPSCGGPHAGRRRAARAFVEGLEEGQYVVHIEHGVGIYRGLVTLTTSGAAREYLLIEYAGADASMCRSIRPTASRPIRRAARSRRCINSAAASGRARRAASSRRCSTSRTTRSNSTPPARRPSAPVTARIRHGTTRLRTPSRTRRRSISSARLAK